MGTNLADNCNLNEALYRSLTVMRTVVHSKIKETPFERHYGRKPRAELTSYLNLPSNVISAKPKTFQSYTFGSKCGDYDQLLMKTLRKLKYDVRNNFPYKFLEKKNQHNNKFESKYETISQTAVAGTKHTKTTDTKK